MRAHSDEDIEIFLRATVPGLLRYATALTGDPHLAADIVQDVLLKVTVRWRRIREVDRPDLYVRRMVTNQHVSWLRRWDVRVFRPVSADVLIERAGDVPDASDLISDRADLLQRLRSLPARQRAVLVLRYLEGLDDGEIADVLGTTATTVRSHASRALQRLRENRFEPARSR